MSEQITTFPTGIYRCGNELVIRTCKSDGSRKNFRLRYKPNLYLPCPPGTNPDTADAFALRGERDPREKTPLLKRQFDNMFDFNNYIKENMDIPGVRLYGTQSPITQAYSELFPEEIKPAFKHVRVFNLDIEVLSSYKNAAGEIVKGPFPEPIIEDEQYRVKKIDLDKYSDSITNFYKWWSVTFPDSVIPTWTNLHAAFPIVTLQLTDKNINKKLVWSIATKSQRGSFVYDPNDEEIGGLDVELREFSTEQDMLKDFVRYWASRQPDFWTGWNTKKFDSPYLAERIMKIIGPDWVASLSPIGKYRKYVEKPKKGLPFTTYEFEGVPNLPYDDLYKKHRLKERARYSLNFICHVELKLKKLTFGDAKSLNNLWFHDYAQYLRYGIRDIDLVDRLDSQLGFINLTIMLGAIYKCNYDETLDTVRPWNSLLYNHNKQFGRYPLIKRPNDHDVDYEGAFVHTPVPGRYKKLLSEDLNSLYPHIEQQYNMGPETKVAEQERRDIIFEMCEELESYHTSDFNRNRARLALLEALREEREIIYELINFGEFEFQTLKRHNVSMTPNLQFFIRDFPSCYNVITRHLYSQRKVYKKEMLNFEQLAVNLATENKKETHEYHAAKEGESNGNTMQMGVKIVMNAGYGAIGNRWLKEYYDVSIARGITAAGQLINLWVTKAVNEFLRSYGKCPKDERFVVYGDTDSIYITLEPIIDLIIPPGSNMSREEKVEAIDKFEREVLQPVIAAASESMARTVNAHEQRMFWGREVISLDGGIFQAKKRYTMLVDNSEGVQYSEAKLKVTGLESKKSSTPEICVKWLEECYKLAIRGDDEGVWAAVKEYRRIWGEQTPEEIGLASSCSNVNKYTSGGKWVAVGGTPYQAHASILHNRIISEFGDEAETSLIGDGSKIILVVLKKNNPYGYGYLAFQDYWPEEFEQLNIRNWIDYEGLFEKNFISPLQLLLDAVKMSTKKKVNVLSFYKKKG